MSFKCPTSHSGLTWWADLWKYSSYPALHFIWVLPEHFQLDDNSNPPLFYVPGLSRKVQECQMSLLCLFPKQIPWDILYLPAKEVFQGQRAVWIPGALRSCKPLKEPCIPMFFSFPTTQFWPWTDFSHCLWRSKAWDNKMKEPLLSGLSPRLRKAFPPVGWSDAVALLTILSCPHLFCPQGRQGADAHSCLGCPQPALKNTALATHSELSPAWNAKKLEVGRVSGHAWAPSTAEQTLLPPSQLCPGQRKPWHHPQSSIVKRSSLKPP